MNLSIVSRVVRRFQASIGLPMTHSESWPEVRNFRLTPEKLDVFQDAYKVEYSYEGQYDLLIPASIYFWFKGDGPPGQYEGEIANKPIRGDWKDPHDVERILKQIEGEIAKASREAAKDLEVQVKSLQNAKWEVDFSEDFGSAVASYRNSDKYDDAQMTVDFENVREALQLNRPQEARIHFSQGADYEGSYGEVELERKYRSLDDMKKLMLMAERLWDKKHRV